MGEQGVALIDGDQACAADMATLQYFDGQVDPIGRVQVGLVIGGLDLERDQFGPSFFRIQICKILDLQTRAYDGVAATGSDATVSVVQHFAGRFYL